MGNLSSKIIIYERLDNISSKFDNKKRKIFSKFSTKKVAEKSDDDDDASGSSKDNVNESSSKEKKIAVEENDDENSPNLAAFSENLSTVGMDATMMDSLPGKMKKSKFVALNKKIEEGMTDDQKKEEAEVRRQQMEQIFRLMKEQEEKLGIVSPDDVVEQMKLYAL